MSEMCGFITRRSIRWLCSCSAALLFLALPPRAATAAPRTFATLAPGEWVEAEVLPDSGRWVTRELDIKKRGTEGTGSLVAPLVRGVEGEILLLGLPIDVAGAAFKDSAGDNAPLESLPEGSIVEAHVVSRDGRLVATKLRGRSADTDSEIEGPVEIVVTGGQPMVRILGLDIAVLDDVKIRTLKKRRPFVRTVDDDELDASSRIRIGSFSLGAVADMGVDPESNYDLNSGREHDIAESDVSGRLQLMGRVASGVHLFAKGGYRRRIIVRDQRNREEGYGRWEFAQGYLLFTEVLQPELAVQVGRQDFDERREWLYDENLDALRVHYLGGKVWAEASISTRFGNESSLTNRWNAMFSLSSEVHEDLEVGAYLIRRMPRHSGEAPTLTWTGLRLLSLELGSLETWGEISRVSGTDGGFSVSGEAAHVSGSLVLEPRSRLSLNGSFAWGSGDDDPGDDTDHNFRQTGLQDNNDRFGGVTSFRYYGELTDPELSNLVVMSGGAGIRPTRSTSIDVMLHRYRQVEPLPELRDSPLDANPTGLSTDIGEEANLVLGFRRVPNLKLEVVFAIFRAGDAFANAGERATLSRVQLQVGF